MPINKIAYQVLELQYENYINILRSGQSVADTGWITYADSPGVNPIDGIGGTASITWAQNTVSPLSGDSDLRLVKGATNRQGDGVSIPFTIANRHLAKVLQISFDMELFSGTYATGDLRVSIIQDPTGTPIVLEPVGTALELGIANQRMREIATFQTHVSITSYRLCIHVSSTSASAYTVDFANFKVWEPTQSIGSVITDPVAYTPTFVGMSPTGLSFTWQRIGKNIRIMGRGTIASNSSTQWSFTTPNGIVPDFGYTSGEGIQVGTITRGAASDGNLLSLLGRNDNLIRFGGYLALNSGSGPLAWNTWNPFGSGEIFNLTVEFPVLGWGSNVAMSSDSGDGRVVAAKYRGLTVQSYTANTTPIRWDTVVYDTHNAVTTGSGWRFTAPISGQYRVSFTYLYQNTDSSNVGVTLWINGDNTRIERLTDINNQIGWSSSTTIFLRAGEYFDLRLNTTKSLTTDNGTISIERISAGSQIIASVEGVSVICRTISNGLTATATGISWTSKEVDSHSSFTASSSRFTAPMSGVYQFDLCFRSNNANSGYSQLYDVTNSVILRTSSVPSDSSIMCGQLSSSVRLLAGQIIEVRLSQAIGTSTLSSNLYDNYLSITRVGNY